VRPESTATTPAAASPNRAPAADHSAVDRAFDRNADRAERPRKDILGLPDSGWSKPLGGLGTAAPNRDTVIAVVKQQKFPADLPKSYESQAAYLDWLANTYHADAPIQDAFDEAKGILWDVWHPRGPN